MSKDKQTDEDDLSIFGQVNNKGKAPKKTKPEKTEPDQEHEEWIAKMQRRWLWENSFTRF